MIETKRAPLPTRAWRVEEVVARPFPPDDTSSAKGSRTWNLFHPQSDTIGRTMVAKRLKGENVGNHFHAAVPGKMPEELLLVVGKVRFWCKDLASGVREIEMDADKDGPILTLVPPFVLHRLHIDSDMALYLEAQPGPHDPSVTFGEEEFVRLSRSMGGIP